MSDGSVVIVGISIVFICMILITLVLYLFPLIFGNDKKNKDNNSKKEKNKEAKEQVVASEPVVESVKNDDKELIAVISAAISAYLGSNSGIKFRVKSFRRVGDNASAWSKTSRLENLSE